MLTCDVAIVGSGFGGSIMALIAQRLGKKVILLERGKHPRFAIGESSTPLANLLLEELAKRYDLPRLLPLTKWGSWQAAYPHVACGLKRGFTFYHHSFGVPFGRDPSHERQLLVGASPRDEIADTHWYRPDFDHFLVQEAAHAGVTYLDDLRLLKIDCQDDRVQLEGERNGSSVRIQARFLIDASGPRGFLHSALRLPESKLPHLPGTQALFSHFQNVRRLDAMGLASGDGELPYPIDDAAVHHVFDGGWIWVLRFNNGLASAGVAVVDCLAEELQLSRGEPAWQRLLDRLPSVRDQFAEATADIPFVHARHLSFRSSVVSGPRWSMLPSAAGFVDPLLSTGFALNLFGITRLARALEFEITSSEFQTALNDHAQQTLAELDRTGKLIATLYRCMPDFSLFAPVSLLYFAAVSFAETARRLDRHGLAGGFLLGNHKKYSEGMNRCCDLVLHNGRKEQLLTEIQKTIALVDVAGLGDKSRRNWYPAKAEDLLRAAPKLEVSESEMQAMIRRCM